MNPVWFKIAGYPVHLYAVMIALGFVVGIWLAARRGERDGIDRDLMLDLSWWLLVAGLVGARVAFIIVNWEQYYYPCVDFEFYNAEFATLPRDVLTGPDCTRLLRFWNGGLVFYGGVIGSMITMVWFLRREKVPIMPVADAIIPSLALGQFFGRAGCFFAGCCWGKPTDAALSLEFPKGSMAWADHVNSGLIPELSSHSHAVYATQLYDALGGLLLFGLLVWLQRRKRFHGQVFITWLLIYPMMRSTIELFRGDGERGFVFEVVSETLNGWLGLPAGSVTFLSTSQFISLAVMAVAAWLLWRQRKASAPTKKAAPPAADGT